MIEKYIIEHNVTTEFKTHTGSDITFYMLEGKCNFETAYKNDIIVLEKSKGETYKIAEKVEYRLQNTCNSPCIMLIMSELNEEDIKKICENYTIWDLNHTRPDTHYNYKNGIQKSSTAEELIM